MTAASNVKYPVVVRPTGFELYFSAGFYVLCVIAAAVATVWYSLEWTQIGGNSNLVGALFCPLFAVGASLPLWGVLNCRLVFTADRLETYNGFWSREIRRQDVRGYHLIARTSNIRLLPKDDTQKSVVIPARLLSFTETSGWLQAVNNLDDLDFLAAEKILKDDQSFGVTSEERLTRLACLRHIAKVSNWTVFGICFWVFAWPRPYLWAVSTAIVIPFVGIILNLFSNGYLRIGAEDDKKDARPSLGNLFLLPAIVLMLRALLDFNIVDLMALSLWSLGLGVVSLTYFSFRSEVVRSKLPKMFMLVVPCVAYFYGSLNEINVLLDKAPIVRFPTVVKFMGVSSGRGRRYEMRVAPWGPEQTDDLINVSRDFYGRHHNGDQVCVYMGRGALGFRWYELNDC